MVLKKLIFGLICFDVLCAISCGNKVLCDGRVVVHSPNELKFSKNEKPLLCGDQGLKPWSEVPLAQTESTMKEFLKGRGFYDSSFFLEGDKLIVYSGKARQVKDVVFIGAPKEFYDIRFIGWKKKDFTAPTLDDIEAYTLRRLKSLGYACVEVTTKAIIETQVVEVYIKLGDKYSFPEIAYEDDLKIKPSVLERFNAFRVGDQYNEDLLNLTSRRIETDGVVTHSNFLTECKDNKLEVKQRISLGTSRLLETGAGASTEEYPIIRVSWKDSRKDKNASIVTATLYGSQLQQSAVLGYEWHAFDSHNRWYWWPNISGNRVDEIDQQYYNFILFTPFGIRHDYVGAQIDFKMGPAGDFEDAQNGPTTGRKAFGLWKALAVLTSHDYDVYFNDPRRGFRFSVETSSVGYSTADQIGANLLKLSGSRLWNILNYGPPKYIFGIRYGLQTVLAVKTGDVRDNIPQDYFSWLGGDNSVRGFSREELPDADVQLGSLSTAFAGAEFRFASLVMKGMDPFVFTDAGLLGQENFHYDTPLYWSPGMGLRWQSFVGVLRATVAHGWVTGHQLIDNEHWQYFISLGQEF